VHTTRYWNNLHYVHSVKRLETQVMYRSLWASRPKVLNRISIYDRGGITFILINYFRYELYIQTIIGHLTINYDTSIIIIWEDARFFVQLIKHVMISLYWCYHWLYFQYIKPDVWIVLTTNTNILIISNHLLGLQGVCTVKILFIVSFFFICHCCLSTWVLSSYISVYSIVLYKVILLRAISFIKQLNYLITISDKNISWHK